jgi:hypothetical protein
MQGFHSRYLLTHVEEKNVDQFGCYVGLFYSQGHQKTQSQTYHRKIYITEVPGNWSIPHEALPQTRTHVPGPSLG